MPAAAQNLGGGRLIIVAALLTMLLGLLLARLVMLQVLDEKGGAEFLKRQGDLRAVRSAEIPVYRGLITDRRGEPLAVSTPVVSLVANPQRLRDSSRIAELAGAIGLAEAELREKLDQYRNKQFMYLLRHQTPTVARRILALGIKGVSGEREYRRFYPAGEVAAHVVGLTDRDSQGISGLELAFQSALSGTPGKKRFIKDLHGDSVRDIGVLVEPEPGESVSLSIDLRLQYLQHRELQRAMIETGADAGAAVTIDAWTGEVLAMSNHPVFNPNSRQFDYQSARNRVVADEFEPGSTMKPLTLVAALESGQFTIDTVIDTSPGRIRVGRKVLPDPKNYGEITVSRVIEKSSQVGVTKIAQQLDHEAVLDVYRRFGLGEPTSVGFPGERPGMVPDRTRWSEIEKVTLAFGYGLTATPLQVASAYGVFANRGRRIPLTLLKRTADDRPEGQQVIAPEIADDVLRVLHRVTGEHGTARKARVAGFEVGGKTGTVHKVGASGYLADQYVALFIGIAPIEAPRYVTAVVIDRPKGDSYGGGSAAAPVYSRITEGVLRLGNVPPSPPHQDAGAQLAIAGGGA
ncbi:penicillin-binding protein [Luminiphilus syltensis NOR5-1B]|uniref:Peptidoglycan D,D-transpeptidase FtsI n=1 Tax=Luminiphilus syltensis NOR5-1B TaxID=565045 RepID=B8KR57_9GAMM|nr:penicillin-binding protein 2 [Luminiphilus syltensis]EED34876.1 penicillin-binding protein [Luminiphilus syltensis NOR5-1B]